MPSFRTQAVALPHGAGAESALATNRVIRNTYLLLAMTLLFSAASAAAAVALKLLHAGPGVGAGVSGQLRRAD